MRLLQVLSAVAVSTVAAVKFPAERLSKDDYIQVIIGLAEGFGLELVEKCIDESKDFGQLVDSAIVTFEKKTPGDVKEGLHLLAEAMTDVFPKAVQACGGTAKEIESIVKAITSFSSPETFVYHIAKDLLVNGIQIFGDINGAIGDWKSKNYKSFGQHVGTALKLVVLGHKMGLGSDPKGVQVVKGVFEGMGATIEDECITVSDRFDLDIEDAIADMMKKNAAAMMEGMMKLIDAFKRELPNATKDCQAAQAKAQEIKKDLDQFKNIQDFVYHVEKDLKVNGVSIYRDLNGAIAAWMSENYEIFGQKAGHAAWLVAIGTEPSESEDILV